MDAVPVVLHILDVVDEPEERAVEVDMLDNAIIFAKPMKSSARGLVSTYWLLTAGGDWDSPAMPPAWALLLCAPIDALDPSFAVEPGLEGSFAKVVVFVVDTGTVMNLSLPPPSPPPPL